MLLSSFGVNSIRSTSERIMEKTARLDARDVEENLCVMLLMLLMLQSANRRTQDSLKMFQDRATCMASFRPKASNRRTRR